MKNIEKLNTAKLNLKNLYSCYDYDALSLQELLCEFFNAINECVENSNEMKEIVEWLKNEGLAQEVVKTLTLWKDDGTLEGLIDESIFKKIEFYPVLSNEVGVVSEKYKYGDVRRFGGVGDGETDNTTAFNNCMQSLGSPWSNNSSTMYIPQGKWKYRESIKITRNNISIVGDGMEQTILLPQECDGIKCIQVQPNYLFGITIRDLKIHGGIKGMDASYVALNSRISNISIEGCSDIGLYSTNSFDFVLDYVIVRNSGKVGIYFEQQENSDTTTFREMSFITFNSCMAIACNGNGKQWHISGNNMYLNNCKANEGRLGVEFTGTSFACRVNNFYMDGTGNDSVMFKLNSSDLRNITINSTYGWNIGTVIQATKCRSFECSNLDVNPENWNYTAIQLDDTFTGICQCDSKRYKIVDNRLDKKPFIYFGDFSESAGNRILIKEVEINMYAGGNEYNYEYATTDEVGIQNIFVTPMNDISYENRDNANKKEIPMIFSNTNKGGYGVVTIKCNGTVNNSITAKLQLMIIIKPSKAWQ